MERPKKTVFKTQIFINELDSKLNNLLNIESLTQKKENSFKEHIKDLMRLLVVFKNEKLQKNEITKDEKLPLGLNTLTQVRIFLKEFSPVIALYNQNSNYKKVQEICLPIVQLSRYLINNYMFLSYQKEINFIQADKELSAVILESYHGLAKSALLLKEYQSAKLYFLELKGLLKQAKLNSTLVKAYFKGIYYSGMALFFAMQSEYEDANLYLAKAEPIMEYILGEGSPSAKLLIFTYNELISNTHNQINLSLVLRYAKAARNFHLLRERIFCKSILNPPGKIYSEQDYGAFIKEARQEIAKLENIIGQCKKDLFHNNIETLKNTIKVSQVLKISKIDDINFSVSIKFLDKKNHSVLKKELAAKNINFNIINDTFILINFYKKNTYKLQLAINSFLEAINIKLATSQHVSGPIADIKPVSYINSSEMPLDTDFPVTTFSPTSTLKIKRTNTNTVEEEADKNPKITTIPVNKYEFFKPQLPEGLIINNERTYQLFGPFGAKQHICIDESFINSIQDEQVGKKLYSLCQRGKILGNSKGQKGFIITGDQVKGKDASKDYRFKGHLVAKQLDDNQKEHTLFVIDNIKWKHKLHG